MNAENVSRREVLALLAVLGVSAGEAGSAFAQSTHQEEGAGGKVVFENDKVRVISHLGRPRMGVCGTGLHSHPPHLTIALTDVRAKVSLQGKEPFLDEQKAGATFWDPGGAHIVENMGGRDSKVYLIELKG